MYAFLTCYKKTLNKKFDLEHPLTMAQLNEKLEILQAYSEEKNRPVTVRLDICEDLEGTIKRFSDNWSIRKGQPSNILVLAEQQLEKYYGHTPIEERNLLLDDLGKALRQSMEAVDDIVQKEMTEPKQAKGLLALVQKKDKSGELVQETSKVVEEPKNPKGLLSLVGKGETVEEAKETEVTFGNDEVATFFDAENVREIEQPLATTVGISSVNSEENTNIEDEKRTDRKEEETTPLKKPFSFSPFFRENSYLRWAFRMAYSLLLLVVATQFIKFVVIDALKEATLQAPIVAQAHTNQNPVVTSLSLPYTVRFTTSDKPVALEVETYVPVQDQLLLSGSVEGANEEEELIFFQEGKEVGKSKVAKDGRFTVQLTRNEGQ